MPYSSTKKYAIDCFYSQRRIYMTNALFLNLLLSQINNRPLFLLILKPSADICNRNYATSFQLCTRRIAACTFWRILGLTWAFTPVRAFAKNTITLWNMKLHNQSSNGEPHYLSTNTKSPSIHAPACVRQ